MVSLTEGSFFRSRVRTWLMKPTICVRSDLRYAGHAAFDDAFLQPLFGEADMKMQAAALERITEIALAVGGQDHRRLHDRHTVPSSGMLTW